MYLVDINIFRKQSHHVSSSESDILTKYQNPKYKKLCFLRFQKKKKIETKIGKSEGAQKDPLVKFYNQRDISPQKIGSFFNITAPLLPHFPNTNTDNSLTKKKK